MEFFQNAKAVRLRNVHNKYLTADDDDEETVTQDRNGSSKNVRWTVEAVRGSSGSGAIRLKSCYGSYLTASNEPFLLGFTGRKVVQSKTAGHLDSSVEWEPVREGSKVKLMTPEGHFLRANGGLPPWRNSVTHDTPFRTSTQEWILWDVDVIEILVEPNKKTVPSPQLEKTPRQPSQPQTPISHPVSTIASAVSTVSTIASAVSTVSMIASSVSTSSDIPDVVSTASDLPDVVSTSSDIFDLVSTASDLPDVVSTSSDIPDVVSTASDLSDVFEVLMQIFM